MTTKEKAKKMGDENVFPLEIKSDEVSIIHYGLSLREYFAGLAMGHMAGNSKYTDIDVIASDAVRIADALLEQLCREE